MISLLDFGKLKQNRRALTQELYKQYPSLCFVISFWVCAYNNKGVSLLASKEDVMLVKWFGDEVKS